MAHSGLCCGLYRGSIYIKDLSVQNAPLLPVGNAEATINQELAEIEQDNFQSLGGKACKVEYIDSVTLDLVLHCTSPENLALAFMGTRGQRTGSAVVDEAHPVNSIDELIPFLYVPRADQPVVVTNVGGGTTYVEGEDYIRTNSGIKIIEGSDIAVDGSNIVVDYTYGNNYYVDAQTVAGKEFLVVLDGVNVGGGSQTPVVLKAWKVKFGPTDSFSLLTAEFASINLSGEILRDDTKNAGSKFFSIEWGQTANGVY